MKFFKYLPFNPIIRKLDLRSPRNFRIAVLEMQGLWCDWLWVDAR